MSGAANAQAPQFQTVQAQHNRNFRAQSVLDMPLILPNQNGMGVADLQRRKMGLNVSSTGQSDTTFEDQIWVKSQPQDLSRKNRKEQG